MIESFVSGAVLFLILVIFFLDIKEEKREIKEEKKLG